MDNYRQPTQRRGQIVEQVTALGAMRMGSITEQHLPTRRSDARSTAEVVDVSKFPNLAEYAQEGVGVRDGGKKEETAVSEAAEVR